MSTLHYPDRAIRSPVQQAKTHERTATYAVALIVGVVSVLVVRTIMLAGTESAAAQDRLMSAIIPIALLIVSLTTLALVRYHMSVAIRSLEQAEHTASRLLQLIAAVQALKEDVRSDQRGGR
jgi:NADH:ubiquinone oxidoreductase subunit 6 (subunit J)